MIHYMKKLIFIITLFIALISNAIAYAERMQGVWVSTVSNLDYPLSPTENPDILRSQADNILDSCQQTGINTIFLQVRPEGDAIYPSKLYPYSRYLTGTQGLAPAGNFDTLAYWINEAHERNMELHAWINPYRVSLNTSLELEENNPARLHPEWTRTYKNAMYLDPGLPEVIDYVTKGITEIIDNYRIDGIHFDDYFYPGKDFPDDESYKKYGNGSSKDDWRRSNTESLIRSVHKAAQKKNIRFGVSPSGIWANSDTMPNGSDTHGSSAYFDLYADTLKWAQEELVDYIAPQIYWYNGYSAADYSTLTKWWSNNLKNSQTDLYIGLGDYRMDQFINDESSPWFQGNEIIKQIHMNKGNDTIKGEIHFRYGSVVNHQALFDKIKEEYSSQPDVSFEYIYIYYDKRGNVLYTKKAENFNITSAHNYAPLNSCYCQCVYFENNKPQFRTINL